MAGISDWIEGAIRSLVARRKGLSDKPVPGSSAREPTKSREHGEVATHHILVLQSTDRGNVVFDRFTKAFRARLDAQMDAPLHVVQVVVGQTEFAGAPEAAVVDYVRATCASLRPKLIMTVGAPAAAFVRRHRLELFPEVPCLLAAVDRRFLGKGALADNVTAVAVVNDGPRLLDDILQVLPKTRSIFMVIGSGSIGRSWRNVLEVEFGRFAGRLDFVWSNELSLREILSRAAKLPRHSAIFFLTFGIDGLGQVYADEQVLAELRASANSPIFGALSPFFGQGVVGGSMISVDRLAHHTAAVATRLLNGATPRTLRVEPQRPEPPAFDWRELRRWRIPESRLPAGSAVHFRDPSVWDEYRPAILTAAAVLTLQSLSIAWLLYERRARKRAEIESRANLALAADAHRRQTIAALTSSIAHELTQPISSIAHNAHALEIAAARNVAAPELAAEIVADIQEEAALASQIIDRHRTWLRSHSIRKEPVELHSIISKSLALVAHDMKVREVGTVLRLSSTPCTVSGDEVLLTQVLVNLLRNAVDAMAGTPRTSRRITLSSSVESNQIEVSVHDRGTGLSPELLETLFNPFVTTKPEGLGVGLAIAQRIVHAHGGTISAHPNEDQGATFKVVLPCAARAFDRDATTAESRR